MSRTLFVQWRELGCPSAPGTYECDGKPVRVRQVNIDAAIGNPDAICHVVVFQPRSGPPQYSIGAVNPYP